MAALRSVALEDEFRPLGPKVNIWELVSDAAKLFKFPVPKRKIRKNTFSRHQTRIHATEMHF